MRRREKEISDIHRIEEVIRQATVCRLGLCQDGRAYIVPMSFGYEDHRLYFHSARTGRKIEILKSGGDVCFEMDLDLGVREGEIACRWTNRYRSVMGHGRVVFLEDDQKRKAALDIIMGHYSSRQSHEYSEAALAKTAVFMLEIEEVSGKESL